MEVERCRGQLADFRVATLGIDQDLIASLEQQPISLIARSPVAAEVCPDVVPKVVRKLPEFWATAESIEGDVKRRSSLAAVLRLASFSRPPTDEDVHSGPDTSISSRRAGCANSSAFGARPWFT